MSLIHQQLSTAKASAPPRASEAPPAVEFHPPPPVDLHPHSNATACTMENLVKPAAPNNHFAIKMILLFTAVSALLMFYNVGSMNRATVQATSTPEIKFTPPEPLRKPVEIKLATLSPPVNVEPKKVEPKDDTLTQLALSLSDMPGVRVRSEQERVVIVFEEGIFSRNYILSSQGKNLLLSLGKTIEPFADKITLTINGHTDNDPVPPNREYKDNADLGLFRANAVAELLSNENALPAALFKVQGLGMQEAPYPNDTPANSARNRTVTFVVEKANLQLSELAQ